jgi:hypothetical protein
VGLTETRLPLIKVKIAYVDLSFLLDSGSVRSFMSAEIFHQLQQRDPRLRLIPSDVTCRSASGEPLSVVGCVSLPIRIANFS